MGNFLECCLICLTVTQSVDNISTDSNKEITQPENDLTTPLNRPRNKNLL